MKTLFDKVWDNHVVAQEEDETLLYVDRCLIHEGSRHTFDTLHEQGFAGSSSRQNICVFRSLHTNRYASAGRRYCQHARC